MFENITKFFKKFNKKEDNILSTSKDAAKERLHLVLMQDRANVSADFLDMMKQEIIEVIKKYIEVDEKAIDVRLTNKENDDGTNGAPALYANIPILNIKNDVRKMENNASSDAKQNTEFKQKENAKQEQSKNEEKSKQEKQEKIKQNEKVNENIKSQKDIKDNEKVLEENQNKPNEELSLKNEQQIEQAEEIIINDTTNKDDRAINDEKTAKDEVKSEN